MIVGDVVPQSVIRVDRPNVKATFKPETGKVAMLLLLGDVDKKAIDSFNSVKALNDLGWVQGDKYEVLEALLIEIREEMKKGGANLSILAWNTKINEALGLT